MKNIQKLIFALVVVTVVPVVSAESLLNRFKTQIISYVWSTPKSVGKKCNETHEATNSRKELGMINRYNDTGSSVGVDEFMVALQEHGRCYNQWEPIQQRLNRNYDACAKQLKKSSLNELEKKKVSHLIFTRYPSYKKTHEQYREAQKKTYQLMHAAHMRHKDLLSNPETRMYKSMAPTNLFTSSPSMQEYESSDDLVIKDYLKNPTDNMYTSIYPSELFSSSPSVEVVQQLDAGISHLAVMRQQPLIDYYVLTPDYLSSQQQKIETRMRELGCEYRSLPEQDAEYKRLQEAMRATLGSSGTREEQVV